MKAIGGYFELELSRYDDFHPKAVKLNTGRSAFEYIIKAKGFTKVYLPYFTCDVLLQPIKKHNIAYEFYSINDKFEVAFDLTKVKDTEALLYTNYFGVKTEYSKELYGTIKNLIIDNAQAFFASPVDGVDTFYSARKFFGVPDGAYLYTDKLLNEVFPIDKSSGRIEHLLNRIDNSAEDGYAAYTQNESTFNNAPILQMSNLTKRMLSSINYAEVAQRRRSNYGFLNQFLSNQNRLDLELSIEDTPMTYPFLPKYGDLRSKLLAQRVYVPMYWPNVLTWVQKSSLEYNYAHNILHLPIDQRYEKDDLLRIMEVLSL